MDEPLQHREEPAVIDVEGCARLMDRKRGLADAVPLDGRSPERGGPTMRVEPGKEEDFRYMRGWLASTEWLDRLIAATEPEAAAGANPSWSPRRHSTGRTSVMERRRLLEWSVRAAPALVGKS
jgi:hypothetical protein